MYKLKKNKTTKKKNFEEYGDMTNAVQCSVNSMYSSVILTLNFVVRKCQPQYVTGNTHEMKDIASALIAVSRGKI